MYCKHCGKEIDNVGAEICLSCGCRVKEEKSTVGGDLLSVGKSGKSKFVAGLFGILLGGYGIHRFYIGDTNTGIWFIVLFFITFGIVPSIWGLVDGIIYLTESNEAFEARCEKFAKPKVTIE